MSKLKKLTSIVTFIEQISALAAVKNFLGKLLTKNTKLGRTVRTFLQAVIGIVTFAYILVQLPGFENFWVSTPASTVVAPAVAIAAITALWNAVEAILTYVQELDS